MAGTRLAKIFNGTIVFAGVVCLGIALANLPKLEINPGYLAVIAFAIVVSPRMTLSLPRANYFLSFSDAVVFFTFVVFGGEHAIIVAFFEMFAHCFYLRRTGKLVKDWILLFNVALSVVVTSIAYVALLGFSSLLSRELSASSTRDLLVMLGVLSLAQFFASSLLAAAYQSLKAGTGIWETWKKECLIISLGQFAGAGLAGAFFKIMHNADPIVIGLAAISIGVLYLSYKQVIGEITSSIVQVEDVEREKAQIERTRRVEAEESAEKLSVALAKEEMANKALRKSERDFAHAALHDNLTGLANRNQFGDSLRKLIAEYKLDPSSEFQVLFLDIRSFKNINDTLGHTIGDKVLTIAAKRFVRMLDAKDIVARIGGDEFAIILRGLGSTAKAQKVARRIYQNITQPFSLSGNHISIDVNIGIAPCDTEYDTPEEILRDADIAMHYAKEKKNGLAVFTKELRDRFLERVRFEMDLRHAIDRNELALHYQPIISLSDGRLIGFEALLRWFHSEHGMIPPNKFIPIAEDSGLIKPMTVWILNEACRQLASWQSLSAEYKNLIVSVNISGKHLSDNELIADVEGALEYSRIKPSTLKLEVTESAAMDHPEHTITLLTRLKQIGVQLSIDDFGTGYSSLSYLHRLPFDTLKIDRSFVYSVGANGENSEILQTIISLAQNLKMRVVAEGIETTNQLSLLQSLGCDYGQGFLMAKPKSKDDTERLLEERPQWLPEVPTSSYDSINKNVADEHLPVF